MTSRAPTAWSLALEDDPWLPPKLSQAEIKAEIEAIAEEIEDLDDRIDELTNEKDDLLSEIEDLQEQLDDAEDEEEKQQPLTKTH